MSYGLRILLIWLLSFVILTSILNYIIGYNQNETLIKKSYRYEKIDTLIRVDSIFRQRV